MRSAFGWDDRAPARDWDDGASARLKRWRVGMAQSLSRGRGMSIGKIGMIQSSAESCDVTRPGRSIGFPRSLPRSSSAYGPKRRKQVVHFAQNKSGEWPDYIAGELASRSLARRCASVSTPRWKSSSSRTESPIVSLTAGGSEFRPTMKGSGPVIRSPLRLASSTNGPVRHRPGSGSHT